MTMVLTRRRSELDSIVPQQITNISVGTLESSAALMHTFLPVPGGAGRRGSSKVGYPQGFNQWSRWCHCNASGVDFQRGNAHPNYRECHFVVSNPNTQLERSPLVMLSFLLSVTSSVVRSKGSPRRSKPSSGLNVISGPRISSSSVRRSRLVRFITF
jgi:hypothetical protein